MEITRRHHPHISIRYTPFMQCRNPTGKIYQKLVALPYIIVYPLTSFEPRDSTIAERVWMMAWMSSWAAGVIFVILHVLATMLIAAMFPHKRDRVFHFIGATYEFAFVLAGAHPAFGGFYEVGRIFLRGKALRQERMLNQTYFTSYDYSNERATTFLPSASQDGQ